MYIARVHSEWNKHDLISSCNSKIPKHDLDELNRENGLPQYLITGKQLFLFDLITCFADLYICKNKTKQQQENKKAKTKTLAFFLTFALRVRLVCESRGLT